MNYSDIKLPYQKKSTIFLRIFNNIGMGFYTPDESFLEKSAVLRAITFEFAKVVSV
jgi:hypothetical protein